jgi:hypothetical protein
VGGQTLLRSTAMPKLRIGKYGSGSRSRDVSRRPPNPSYTIVALTEGYTYAANVWALSLVQGRFSVSAGPCNLSSPIRNFVFRCTGWSGAYLVHKPNVGERASRHHLCRTDRVG